MNVRDQRWAPDQGSNATDLSLPVTITTGRLVTADALVYRPGGNQTVVTPVRRPWNASPLAGSMRACQMLSPVVALSAATTPSDHLVITTETLPPTLDLSIAVTDTTSAGHRRNAQCGVISRIAVTGVSAYTRRWSA